MTQKTSIYSTKNQHLKTHLGFQFSGSLGQAFWGIVAYPSWQATTDTEEGFACATCCAWEGFLAYAPKSPDKLGCWLSTAPCYPSAGLLDFASWIARICCFQFLVWQFHPVWQLRKLKSSFPKGNFQMFGSFKQANHPWFSNQQPYTNPTNLVL